MSEGEVIALLIAFGSLIVAIIALRKNSRTQKQLMEIEEARERDRLRETCAARLVARIVRDPYPGYSLLVENKGNGEARDIEITLDDKRLRDHPAFFPRVEEVGQAGPHSSFRYHLVIADQDDPPSEVTITWSDDSGEPGSYRTTLTL